MNPAVAEWLESPEGEAWSSESHGGSLTMDLLVTVKEEVRHEGCIEKWRAAIWYSDESTAISAIDPGGSGDWKYA